MQSAIWNLQSWNCNLQSDQAEELRRKREAQLRQYVFFQLRVHLKSGSDLVAMDKNGETGKHTLKKST